MMSPAGCGRNIPKNSAVTKRRSSTPINQAKLARKNSTRQRKAVHDVDEPESPIHAIVSVLMLREGYVQNVTVVVGLGLTRPKPTSCRNKQSDAGYG